MSASLLAASPCVAEENASNPLAKVKNTDVRAQYFDNPDGSYTWDLWLADGAFMATDKVKIKYEVHYWVTDITGSSENDLESLHVKPIYFPKKGTLGKWKYQMAVGGDMTGASVSAQGLSTRFERNVNFSHHCMAAYGHKRILA